MHTTATRSWILGPPHISGSNSERKLKFGTLIDMHRSFNIDENFSPLGDAFTTPRRNRGFLGPSHTSGSN